MSQADPRLEAPYPAEPERLPTVPRVVALNRKARFYRTALLCAVLLAPNGILAWGWVAGDDLRALEDRGQSVLGSVVDKSSRSGRGGKTYFVTYEYDVNGRNYRDTRSVSADEYTAAEKNASYFVTYLPERPATNTPGRPGPRLQQDNENTVRFAIMATAALGVWYLWFAYLLRREQSLAREGEAVIGNVTERGTTRGRNQISYWVRHQFTSPADETITDWNYVPSSLFDRLRPGVRITLLFDPANAKRHLPLYAFEYAYIVESSEEEYIAPDQDLAQLE